MPKQQLSDYVKEQFSKNIPVHIIRDALLEKGWNIIDVDEAITDARNEISLTKTKSTLKESEKDEIKQLVAKKLIIPPAEKENPFIRPKIAPIRRSKIPLKPYFIVFILCLMLALLFLFLRSIISRNTSFFG